MAPLETVQPEAEQVPNTKHSLPPMVEPAVGPVCHGQPAHPPKLEVVVADLGGVWESTRRGVWGSTRPATKTIDELDRQVAVIGSSRARGDRPDAWLEAVRDAPPIIVREASRTCERCARVVASGWPSASFGRLLRSAQGVRYRPARAGSLSLSLPQAIPAPS